MSWVIIDKNTGVAVLETFNKKIADAINVKKYKAIPIMEYLQNLNKKKD